MGVIFQGLHVLVNFRKTRSCQRLLKHHETDDLALFTKDAVPNHPWSDSLPLVTHDIFLYLQLFFRINTARKQGGLGNMDIPLLADKNCDIAKTYGVYKEDDGVAFR